MNQARFREWAYLSDCVPDLLYGGPMSYGLWHEANIQAEFSE